MTVTCFFCSKPIDPDGPTTWQATSCFTRRHRIRTSGRSRAMSDRVVYRYLEQFAHDECIAKNRRGLIGQESIL
jgi:hypothetical protein